MLRNYDKLGLLVPARIDEETGYRYYLENQLTAANRIQALKAMGLSLQTIREILAEYHDAESLAGYLEGQAEQKHQEHPQHHTDLRL